MEKKGIYSGSQVPTQNPKQPKEGENHDVWTMLEVKTGNKILHKQEEKIQDQKGSQGEGSRTFPAHLTEVQFPQKWEHQMPPNTLQTHPQNLNFQCHFWMKSSLLSQCLKKQNPTSPAHHKYTKKAIICNHQHNIAFIFY